MAVITKINRNFALVKTSVINLIKRRKRYEIIYN